MMGIVMNCQFPTYPNGFPIPLIKEFEDRIGSQVIGNRPASGTAIIAELGEQHMESHCPIIYTSADSVFQIACHEEIVPIERLYEFCEIARKLLVAPNNVQRVIARPFVGNVRDGFTRTGKRKDYPILPPQNLLDELEGTWGVGVVPELFSGRGFRSTARTQSNAEHESAVMEALASDANLIFANFEDFDMLYGHRNDARGFGKCLEDFDSFLGRLLPLLREEDLLILTADHGNDPTDSSTDHTREFVPACLIGSSPKACDLGDIHGFSAIGATVAAYLGVRWNKGTSLL
jgi:phosphopentomutase